MDEILRVDAFTQDECPVSVISRYPELDQAAAEILLADDIHISTGATVYGPDAAQWPAKWFDLVRIAGSIEINIKNLITNMR